MIPVEIPVRTGLDRFGEPLEEVAWTAAEAALVRSPYRVRGDAAANPSREPQVLAVTELLALTEAVPAQRDTHTSAARCSLSARLCSLAADGLEVVEDGQPGGLADLAKHEMRSGLRGSSSRSEEGLG